MGILKEFREFAVRGNVIDMAVGIIIGVAFGAVVNSLVNDVMMPPLGYAAGRVDFSDMAIRLSDSGGKDGKPVEIKYGLFINAIINFVIVAFAVFLLVKGINKLRRTQAAAPPPPAPPTKEEVLLTEIRDLLKGRSTIP